MDIYPAKDAETAIEQARAHLEEARGQAAKASPYGLPDQEVVHEFAQSNVQAAQALALIAIYEELAAIRAALVSPSPSRPRWFRRGGAR